MSLIAQTGPAGQGSGVPAGPDGAPARPVVLVMFAVLCDPAPLAFRTGDPGAADAGAARIGAGRAAREQHGSARDGRRGRAADGGRDGGRTVEIVDLVQLSNVRLARAGARSGAPLVSTDAVVCRRIAPFADAVDIDATPRPHAGDLRTARSGPRGGGPDVDGCRRVLTVAHACSRGHRRHAAPPPRIAVRRRDPDVDGWRRMLTVADACSRGHRRRAAPPPRIAAPAGSGRGTDSSCPRRADALGWPVRRAGRRGRLEVHGNVAGRRGTAPWHSASGLLGPARVPARGAAAGRPCGCRRARAAVQAAAQAASMRARACASTG